MTIKFNYMKITQNKYNVKQNSSFKFLNLKLYKLLDFVEFFIIIFNNNINKIILIYFSGLKTFM